MTLPSHRSRGSPSKADEEPLSRRDARQIRLVHPRAQAPVRRLDHAGDDLASRHGFPGAAWEAVDHAGRRCMDRERGHAALELFGRFLRERQARPGALETREAFAGGAEPVVGLGEGALIGLGGGARDGSGLEKPGVRFDDLAAVFPLPLEIVDLGLRIGPLGRQPQRLRASIESLLRELGILQPQERRAFGHAVAFVSQQLGHRGRLGRTQLPSLGGLERPVALDRDEDVGALDRHRLDRDPARTSQRGHDTDEQDQQRDEAKRPAPGAAAVLGIVLLRALHPPNSKGGEIRAWGRARRGISGRGRCGRPSSQRVGPST